MSAGSPFPIHQVVGRNIRFLREQAGLTQEQLQKKLGSGCGSYSVARWEAGFTCPDQIRFHLLAKLFGKSIVWFFQDREKTEFPEDQDLVRRLEDSTRILDSIRDILSATGFGEQLEAGCAEEPQEPEPPRYREPGIPGILEMLEYAIRDAWNAKDWDKMIDLCNQYRELRNTL